VISTFTRARSQVPSYKFNSPKVAGKNLFSYVTRRFTASLAGLSCPWGWTFAGTPLSQFPGPNWSPKSAEVRPHLIMCLVRMVLVPCGTEALEPTKKDLMTSKIIISRAACLAELTSNPKSFSNCSDLHGGVAGLPGSSRSKGTARIGRSGFARIRSRQQPDSRSCVASMYSDGSIASTFRRVTTQAHHRLHSASSWQAFAVGRCD